MNFLCFCFFYLLRWDQKLGGLEVGVFLPLGHYALLIPQSFCVLSCFSPVQLFATLWTIVRQAPLSIGFSRQEYWSGLLFPSPGDLPNPGISPRSTALQGDSSLSETPGKPTPEFRPLLTSLPARQALSRGTECSGIFQRGFFSLFPFGSKREFFSDIYYGYLASLLQVNLTML